MKPSMMIEGTLRRPAPVARRPVVAILLFFLALIIAGCGGDEKAHTKSKAPATKKTDESDQDETGTVSSKGKKWGGWRWKGKRDDCFFVYKNNCYTTREDACAAAKCKKGECVFDKSAPAKASCQKDD